MNSETRSDGSPSQPTKEERFVKFQYAEMKDLTKHFLTLIAGTLVLTVTLSEKILGPTSGQYTKSLLVYAWVTLIVAFMCAGAGLAGIFFAALAAREGADGKISICGISINYQVLAKPSYLSIDLAGILYVVALILLVIVGTRGFGIN